MIRHTPRILFLCKKNECYGFETYTRRSSGLYNSTRFIVESLRARGVHAEILELGDNNDIDREVTQFKPTLVVIEALWVVPSKFPILMKLHPRVKWAIHLHSQIPFLALEGIAMEWLHGYHRLGLELITNSPESWEALSVITPEIRYLPNVYLGKPRTKCFDYPKHAVDIGCFGAVRPLKNQLLQALAAIDFARDLGKTLYFHVNSSRVETGGMPVLKNLVELFAQTPKAQLVRSKWNEPEEFIDYLHLTIDIGMQVSLTETFNVVTADYITAGCPIVVSKAVAWASRFSTADEECIGDIVSKLHRAYENSCLVWHNQRLLLKYSGNAQRMWYDYVRQKRD